MFGTVSLIPLHAFVGWKGKNVNFCTYFFLTFSMFDGFGGLVVSMLASGTRVCGFKPGRSRWIFRASEKSSACIPSEGK